MKKLAVILLSLIIASSFAACSSSSDADAAALLNALQSNASQVSEKVSDIQEQASQRIEDVSSAIDGNQASSQQPTEVATEEAENASGRIQLSGSGKVEDLEISMDYIEGSTIYCTINNHSEKTDYRLGFVNGKIKMKTVDGNVYYITDANSEILGEQKLQFFLNFPGYEGKSLPKTITFMSIIKSSEIGPNNEKELTINVKS